jgi:hypothetical protein
MSHARVETLPGLPGAEGECTPAGLQPTRVLARRRAAVAALSLACDGSGAERKRRGAVPGAPAPRLDAAAPPVMLRRVIRRAVHIEGNRPP